MTLNAWNGLPDPKTPMTTQTEKAKMNPDKQTEAQRIVELAAVQQVVPDSAEAAQWRNINKVVKSLADFCFGSKDDPKWGLAHIAITHSLIAKDGLDVQALGLEKLAAHPTQQGLDAREFPAMTPELASILGLMCFQCIPFAQALRAGGQQIDTRAEDEQAAVLHWMLGHYFRHGEAWRDAAAEDMERMKTDALAAQAKQGGAA